MVFAGGPHPMPFPALWEPPVWGDGRGSEPQTPRAFLPNRNCPHLQAELVPSSIIHLISLPHWRPCHPTFAFLAMCCEPGLKLRCVNFSWKRTWAALNNICGVNYRVNRG